MKVNSAITPDTQSFTIAAVMREPPFVVDRFVQHYRALGAEKIILLWDGLPGADQRSQLEALAPPEILQIHYCDSDFWNTIGLTKTELALDDILNAGFTFAYEQCDSDWILFCDSDEFLHAPQPVPEFLSQVPSDILSVRVRNLEAVWGPGDDLSKAFGCSYFRAPINLQRITRFLSWVMLGRYAVFSRGGMMGHFAGKHFLRTGLKNVSITSHQSTVSGQDVGKWAHKILPGAQVFFFAHFDAISEERWVEKWRRRISAERISDRMAPQRAAQQKLVQEAIENGTTHELFSRLYGLTRLQAFILNQLGLLTRAQPIRSARNLTQATPSLDRK